MLYNDTREWIQKYEFIKTRIQRTRKSSNGVTPADKKSISAVLVALDTQLRSFSASPIDYEIVPSELARRQILLDNLKKQVTQAPMSAALLVTHSLSSASASNDSNNSPMHPRASGAAFGDAPASGGGGGGGVGSTQVHRHKDMIRLQDEMLQDIERGVGRLLDQAGTIKEEAREQTSLMGGLEARVDEAARGLESETERARQMRLKVQLCWMYGAISAELILLLLLIIGAVNRNM